MEPGHASLLLARASNLLSFQVMSLDSARPTPQAGDPLVDQLAGFFRNHPAWRRAARILDDGCTSRVTFRHRPGEEWRLLRRGDRTVLERGTAEDPDFAFDFSTGAIDRITSIEGDVADFAIELLTSAMDPDEERSVTIEVVAPFHRLLRRGYVRLLLAGGGPLLTFGWRHGVRTMRDLQDLVSRVRRQ